MIRGAATMYGIFFAVNISLATSACLPPSILPAGPPTKGNPIVFTIASTTMQSFPNDGIAILPLPLCVYTLH